MLAFRGGETSSIAPFRYVSIPLSIVLGWLVFGDVPRWNMLLGALVIDLGRRLHVLSRALARPATSLAIG